MRSTGVTIRCTSIGTLQCGLIAAHTSGADRQVGNVMVVHHVEMQQVGAGGDDGAHFLAKAREIGGQQRRSDARGHDAGTI